jgi:hypothetical protein
MTNKQTARDDAAYYHFDIHGIRDAGFKPFAHDYQPVYAPIDVPLAQDLPDKVVRFSPGSLDTVVDPYLPIAKLRKQFEGKGRKLGGYLVLLDGLWTADGSKGYDMNNIPAWNNLAMDFYSYGMTCNALPEVHPFAVFHLNYCLAYFERRINFHELVRTYQEDIKSAPNPQARQEEIDAFNRFKNFSQTSVDQGDPKAFAAILDGFPKPAQQRQVSMPPDTVRIPVGDDCQLGWNDLEASIKRLMEDAIAKRGWIAISCVNVIACDDLGAYTIACGEDKFSMNTWCNYGNVAYWVNMQTAFFSCLGKWLPDTDKSFFEFRDFIHDRYGLWMDEYFARDMDEGWQGWFDASTNDWLAKMRVEYRNQLQKDAQKKAIILIA